MHLPRFIPSFANWGAHSLTPKLVGFVPAQLTHDISHNCLERMYDLVKFVGVWLDTEARGQEDTVHREVDVGLYQLETLLESHMDKAFDKFAAWALRNTFDFPSDLDVVLVSDDMHLG